MARRTTSGKPTEDVGNVRGARPWANFAKPYFEAGWCPLPLPPRRKSSPPTGSTGKYDMPDQKKLAEWYRNRDPRGNIALRVPDDVIGIDVDAYAEKVGAASLAELEQELGPLPDTWTLTSRRDGISGIRFYRVPKGLHWSGEPIPDIQIVQHHHRYAVAYPSIHPDTKEIYLWYAPGDPLNGRPSVTIENEIPQITELVDLPVSWVDGLTSGRMWSALAADTAASRGDIVEWVKARPAGQMCRLMRKQAELAVEEIGVGGAHDTLNSRVYSVISLAAEGHSGVSRAVRKIRDAFYEEVRRPGRKGRRSEAEARAEFNRVRDGAVRIMMASVRDGESTLEEECGCAGNSLDWGEKLGLHIEEPAAGAGVGRAKLGKAKAADKYTFDDSGNAEHMLDILDGSAYFVPEQKSWVFWSPSLGAWQRDTTGSRALQAAQLVGKRCRELSDDYMQRLAAAGSSLALDTGGDVAQKIGQLDKHAKLSSDHKGLVAMTKVAASQSRAMRLAAEFDANVRLLACPNGTLELSPSGAVFRRPAREDLCSLSTGTPYVPGAVSEAWSRYLDKFVPVPAIRRYLQKIAGYSLIGDNPERKMFFMQGGTSTGKTTFVNAYTAALGQYAGTMNLSLFRANQDEKPRPDLVASMTKRLLTASEASAEWWLHGDQIKRLTGGDPISARWLHANEYISRRPAFTPWIATNAMPQVHGSDQALARRLVRVPFEQVVKEGAEDFSVAEALSSASGRSAVLAWAVEGWELYREDRGLVAPEEVVEATRKMLAELTDIDVFLSLHVVADPDGDVVFSDLFDRWRMWCAESNVDDSKMSANKFGRELTGRGFETDIKKVKGEVIRIRKGLTWVGKSN